MSESPAIIVLAYRRLYSLQRLLYSLVMAGKAVQSSKPFELIISLDEGADEEVINFCNNFYTQYFTIQIIVHDKKLGVDAHNLWAMEQAENAGAVIVLEDDTMVSPSMFYYAFQALAFYKDDSTIAGISLYNYERNEACNYPFIKLRDTYDNYFYQKASSRGLLITHAQWLKFKKFKSKNKDTDIPLQIQNWGDEVWEKKFNTFLIEENKYWVYPHLSLTTNFGEPGAHVTKEIYRHAFQSIMQEGTQVEYKFQELKNSFSIYDAYGEPTRIVGFAENEITTDILGVRDLLKIKTKYILTSRNCSQFSESYSLDLKPPESNIKHNLRGDDLKVTEVKYVSETKSQAKQRLQKLHYYFYPDKGLLHLLRLKITEIIHRIPQLKGKKS